MDNDLLLTVGVVVGVLAIPSLLGAWTEGRTPRAGAIMVLIAGVLIAVAASQTPGGYAIGEVPQIMLAVVGRYLN
jgi:hypothetical protein